MNTAVRHPEATTPVYDVSKQGYSLVDGRDFIVDAPLEDLEAELRVRDDVGGWAQ